MDSLSLHQISGSYCSASSLIVEGGAKILCPYTSEVKAISLPSGELVGVFRKHESMVTNVELLSRSETDTSGIVVSSSRDGHILVWRWRDFQIMQELHIGIEVYGFKISSLPSETYRVGSNSGDRGSSLSSTSPSSSLGTSDLYLLTSKVGSKHDNDGTNESRSNSRVSSDIQHQQLKLVLYDAESKKVRKKITSVTSRQCLGVMSIRELDHLVVANKRKVLLVSTKTRNGPKFLSNVGNITCLATHSEKGLLITGHEYGEISIWHDIPHWMQSVTSSIPKGKDKNRKSKKDKKRKVGSRDDEEGDDDGGAPTLKPPVMTTFHWHAHAVRCLSFSSDGGYCYSGGEEGVLVMWQLATGIKSFIPRMGGTVAHVAAERGGGSNKIAVTTLDNAVHLVDVSRMREEWTLQSLFVASSAAREVHSNMEAIPWAVQGFRQRVCREPVNGFLVSTGAPGQLQAFDPYTRQMRWCHEVVRYTRVSRTEKHLKIYAPAVLDLAHQISSNGTVYLATLDARRGEDKTVVYSLKFWVWDRSKARYLLSAQVEEPHGVHRVTCMAFIPSDARVTAASTSTTQRSTDYLISGAEDGGMKVWKAVESVNREDNSKQVLWTCAFSFRHKDHSVSALALSGDGSLLALAQQNMISFFSPLSVAFKRSLMIPRADNISHVAFVEPRSHVGSGEAYLLVGSATKMALFDLLTMAMLWEKNSSERFVEFSVVERQDDSLFFGDEEEEDGEANDDGTISRNKRAYIAAAESTGKVTLYSIGSSVALAEMKVHGRVLALEFGAIQTNTAPAGDGSSAESPGVYVTTSFGLSFLSNYTDVNGISGVSVGTNAGADSMSKVLLGQSSDAVTKSKAAALEVLGQSIADPSYSHAQEMEVDDGYDVVHSKVNSRGSADTRQLSTKSLPPVSSLIADFLGAHLLDAASASGDPTSSSFSSFSSSSSDNSRSIVLPGEFGASGGANFPSNSSPMARRRYSTSGLPIETDSSSGEEEGYGDGSNKAQEEESRVNMKRRRSSSLESYQGTNHSAEREGLDFMRVRSSGNFDISFV